MAANFDPAFERRIRTHVLFEMPGVVEREQIWRVQMHPTCTPLAPDVDLRALAEKYDASGGDIRNAVLKAAMAAASEPGPDASKLIHQRHFEEGLQDVLAGKRVMQQSLARPADTTTAADNPAELLRVLESHLHKGAFLPTVIAAVALLIAIAALTLVLVR
jgi:ATP-dependent Zn protease